MYANVPYAMFGLLAAQDGTILVAGRNPGSGISVALVGVNAQNGSVIWKRAVSGPVGSSVDLLFAEAGRVYAGAGGELRSIDPLTGEDLWSATEP